MRNIYSVEEYRYDKDAWAFVGDFISYEDAKKVADQMSSRHPYNRYSVFAKVLGSPYEMIIGCVYSV